MFRCKQPHPHKITCSIPCTLTCTLTASNMEGQRLLAFSFLILLNSPVDGFFQLPSRTSQEGLTLCPGIPEPYARPEQLKEKLSIYLEQVSKEISELVEKDVGGTVVNIVYRDAVIWSGGFGVRNMSG